MRRSEETATRRELLRSAGAGAAAVSAGVAGASASAAAQEGNETTTDGEDGHGGGGHGGGQLVLTDSLAMILGFVVLGILSPLAFAAFLARKYRDTAPSNPRR